MHTSGSLLLPGSLKHRTAALDKVRLHMPLRQLSHFAILFAFTVLLQGCTILAWIGMVSTDVARSSDVEFLSFENVWAAPSESQQHVALRHVAVAPFDGNLPMAEWWADALRLATDRDVTGPAELTAFLTPNVMAELAQSAEHETDIVLAKQMSAEMNVDAVLFGRIAVDPPMKAFWGLKDRYRQRLFLRLITSEGTLLWKAELPFTLTKGAKEIDEEFAKRTLMAHVTSHENELRWRELGLLEAAPIS